MQREEIEHQLDEHLGVAAHVPAVRQDLAAQLVAKRTLRFGEAAVVTSNAEVGKHEGREPEQAGVASRAVAPARRKAHELRAEARDNGLVSAGIGPFEQQVRV